MTKLKMMMVPTYNKITLLLRNCLSCSAGGRSHFSLGAMMRHQRNSLFSHAMAPSFVLLLLLVGKLGSRSWEQISRTVNFYEKKPEFFQIGKKSIFFGIDKEWFFIFWGIAKKSSILRRLSTWRLAAGNKHKLASLCLHHTHARCTFIQQQQPPCQMWQVFFFLDNSSALYIHALGG